MKNHIHKHHLHQLSISAFWFFTGVILGLFLLLSFSFLIFQAVYAQKVYPGISIGNLAVSGKTEEQVIAELTKRNRAIGSTIFTLTSPVGTATISAKSLNIGYNAPLLAEQAISIGRSADIFSNITLVFQAYLSGITLSPSYTFDEQKLTRVLTPFAQEIQVTPVNAVFTFQNNKVTAFKPSSDGQKLDMGKAKQTIEEKIPYLLETEKVQQFVLPLSIQTVPPAISTSQANSLGIKELIGVGTSLYQHSAPSRAYNIALAASRITGALIAPGQVFSFDKTVGDISSFTGYQQAYVIENGKTVLGDGGGVCQVSTTLFRAALNSGLPIVERHAHAYRVGYYEEDSPPGIDATIYVPTVDLKFSNDTGHYILIQSVIDPNTQRLTFYFYGTSDGRKVNMTTPTISNETPPPPPLYTDDPNLPAGTLQQTDFAAGGADVSFSRTVTKDGKTIIADTYTSEYQPWQAAYLRGTGPAQ